jgi:hypothetical protein
VEVRGHLQQPFRHQVKEKPRQKNPESALSEPQQSGKGRAFEQGHPRQLLQTIGTDNPVIVLGDTFPTEELAALGTTRHGFTHGMIEATLVKEILHRSKCLGDHWR